MCVEPTRDKVSIDINYTISLAHPLKLVNLLDKIFEGIKVNQEKIPGSRAVGGVVIAGCCKKYDCLMGLEVNQKNVFTRLSRVWCHGCWMLQNV